MSRLLWVDGTAGAVAGVLVLVFSEGLARLHGLPRGVLVVLGAAMEWRERHRLVGGDRTGV